jgi:hypothetical protein
VAAAGQGVVLTGKTRETRFYYQVFFRPSKKTLPGLRLVVVLKRLRQVVALILDNH